MQSSLDSSSLSGAICQLSPYTRSNEPTWIADNVAEIAPDNSSLEMLATAAIPHMKELLGILLQPTNRTRYEQTHLQGWARDVRARDRDETETLTSRDREETETLTSPAETRR